MFAKKIVNGVMIMVCLLVIGCSSDSDEFADAINSVIKNKKTCFSLQDNHVTWPIRMRRLGSRHLNTVLAAMQSAGYLKITEEKEQMLYGVIIPVDVISPTEEAKGWWDDKEGFCVGTREVVEIQEWTEPSRESGQPIRVTYTWHLNAPSWADRSEFKNIEGLGEPIVGHATLHRTNNGWRAK